MKKLTGESLNITKENIAAMRQLFPEAFEEGKIDFSVLRQLLGDFVDDEEERYSFKWNGKGKALRLSQTPSLGTLRPCKEESKNWDTTQNLYIEGDNLEVLKLLQKSYYGKVKMIYIDPPYNTGTDFIYKDDTWDNIKNYHQYTNQIDSNGHKIDTNTEANGRFHTNWLNMMYPRLRLARNLLSDDGVIFISIDDNEQENLKRICDEVFFDDNYVATLIWDLGTGTTAGHFTRGHEYIICYSKDKSILSNFANYNEGEVIRHGALKKISHKNPAVEITFPAGFEFEGTDAVFSGEIGDSEKEYILSDEMRFINGKLVSETTLKAGFAMRNQVNDFIAGKEVFDTKGQKVKKFYFNSSGILFYEKEKSIINPRTVISGVANTKNGTSELTIIFDDKFFDFPKPSNLIKYLLQIITSSDSLILDFFSGSATTAHAVMKLNAEDGGNRKFIMVQLPEPTAENSEAAKAGYKNICEIGKERIRRAGEKIKAECPRGDTSLDIGFKVFKLDSSNLQKWNPQPEDLQLALQEATDNFLPGRSQLDVVYEILLKMGLDLALPIEERQSNGETFYIIGDGALMICLGEHITLSIAEKIAKLHKEYDSELWQVVFRDTGFASDMDKTNIKETLKTAGLDEDSFVCV